jgi:exonuclease III
MAGDSFNFTLMSFNVRGLRCSKKRHSIFRFVKRKIIDIYFYSHGGNDTRGVMILIRAGLDFKLEDMRKDQQGRLLIMQCTIQGSPFQITNQYAPNTTATRLNFFKQIQTLLDRSNRKDTLFSSKNILGGVFNTIMNTKLDRKGGSGNFAQDYMKSIKFLNEMQEELDLHDELRLRNPDVQRFTWRQKKTKIFSRS